MERKDNVNRNERIAKIICTRPDKQFVHNLMCYEEGGIWHMSFDCTFGGHGCYEDMLKIFNNYRKVFKRNAKAQGYKVKEVVV